MDVLALIGAVMPAGSLALYLFLNVASRSSSTNNVPASKTLVYVQQAFYWPLFIAWIVHNISKTKWTAQMLTNAVWMSFGAPFLGNWFGILYFLSYAEAEGRFTKFWTWVNFAIYLLATVFLAIL